MKKIITATTVTFTAFLLCACSIDKVVNPSQNSALNSVTSSTKEKSGAMQSSLDNWMETKWTPSVENNPEIKEKYSDKERDFKLQEYVEKAELYAKENNESDGDSHVEKINSLPVIGKTK